MCSADPGAWAIDADDSQIAMNDALRGAALLDCKMQLNTVCKIMTLNDLVVGSCAL